MSLKKADESLSRETPRPCKNACLKRSSPAMEKAMKGEKVRYKSNRDPERFLEFLEYRLKIWEQLQG
jgi:hypothetical protein